MDWVEDESVWFICPGLPDVFVWREAFQGLEPACEVVGDDEVGQVASELVVRLIVIAVDGCLLDGAVHSLDLAVRPRVVGFSQAVLDAVSLADLVEAVDTITSGPAIAVARKVSELDAVISENGVKPVGHGCNQGFQEAHRDRSIGLFVQLDERKFSGAVDGNEEVELAFLGADLGDVDVEVADRIYLEFALVRLVAIDLRQARDAVALQAAMQR